MPPLRIIILSDGRPGHFNLSEGMAAAIERIRPATTTRLEVRRGRWSGALLAGLTRAKLPPRALLRAIYGIDEAAVPPCDVILSAGAETLAASIWLARARAIPNIFYGSLRWFDPTDFSLVLTSYERNAGKPRHALALKPSRYDPDSLPPAPAPAAGAPCNLGLLIGGNAGGIRYETADWDGLFGMIGRQGETGRVRWLIANSRRTPPEIGDRLAREAQRSRSSIGQFLDVRTAGPGTLAALLAQCHAVACTADSSSMISESVWSRKPTLVLAPAICVHTLDETGYRNWLEHNRWCREITIEAASTLPLDHLLAPIHPLAANPLDALADLFRERMPWLTRS